MALVVVLIKAALVRCFEAISSVGLFEFNVVGMFDDKGCSRWHDRLSGEWMASC